MVSTESNWRVIRPIKGVDKDSWNRLKAVALLERKGIGQKVNELIEDYRQRVGWP